MASTESPGAGAVGALLERALGAPVALLAFDADGALVHKEDAGNVAPELEPGFTLPEPTRFELRAGRRHALSAHGGHWECLCAEDAGGTLRVALVRAEPRLDLARFAQHLVHGLRNSLSSVKLAVQTLARSESVDAREKRRVAVAAREIARIERTLSTASEYARMPARQTEQVDLSALLRTAVAATQGELEARSVTLHLELVEPAPSIAADGQRLLLCLENLLAFGARSMPEGGELDLALSFNAGAPLVTFRDRGPDLSPEDRASLFVPLATGARATGLDLPLLAAVARELGGAVEAEAASPGLRLRIWLGPRGKGAHGHAAAGG